MLKNMELGGVDSQNNNSDHDALENQTEINKMKFVKGNSKEVY